MKKRLLASLVLALVLLGVSVAPAMAAEEASLPATVTIATIISVSISDPGDPGLNFGTIPANWSGHVMELYQAENYLDNDPLYRQKPSMELVINYETNCGVSLWAGHTPFTDGVNTINSTLMHVVVWNDDYYSSAIPYTESSAPSFPINTSWGRVQQAGNRIWLYHWLVVQQPLEGSIPAGNYTETIMWKAVQYIPS